MIYFFGGGILVTKPLSDTDVRMKNIALDTLCSFAQTQSKDNTGTQNKSKIGVNLISLFIFDSLNPIFFLLSAFEKICNLLPQTWVETC